MALLQACSRTGCQRSWLQRGQGWPRSKAILTRSYLRQSKKMTHNMHNAVIQSHTIRCMCFSTHFQWHTYGIATLFSCYVFLRETFARHELVEIGLSADSSGCPRPPRQSPLWDHRISSDIIGYHRISDQGTDPKELSTTLRGLGMSGGCVGGFMRILSYGILRQTLETFYTHYSYIQSLITSNHIWVHWFQYDNPKESEDSKKIQSDSDCKWL